MSTPMLAAPIALVGLGISNSSVKRLLEHLGVSPADILIFDDRPREGVISDPTFLKRSGVRTLVVSPGYPLSRDWIAQLRTEGVVVTSEIDFAARFLDDEEVVAVTGSLGKSTTTTLIAEGLRASGKSYFVGGNLGKPLADYVLDCLQGRREKARYVALELSSFQLECASHLPVDVGVLTYFCSNHLERYASLEHYYDIKLSLFERVKRRCFSNAASSELHEALSSRGFLSAPKLIETRVDDSILSRSDYDRKKLVGEHNCENLALAAAVLDELGLWGERVKVALLGFPGLEHRMQKIDLGPTKPVFINDSKATALESVITAIHSVLSDGVFRSDTSHRLLCLIGGRDKKHPWEKLSSLAGVSHLELVFFGECAEEVRRLSGLGGDSFPDLRTAMKSLATRTGPKSWVLLSPGGTSLDEFKNFEDRGAQFVRWAQELWI
jgi:UDP-N-acetylmuramoylalanine--D-glutamate ligase